MEKRNASCCLFCASPFSPTDRPLVLGKPKLKCTIKERLEFIVILRDILGLAEGKLNHFRGKLHSGDGIQVCASCGEAVGRCVEAVQEIAKLQNRVANISSSLKDKIHATWMEEGDGEDSLWGHLRLEALELKELRNQETFVDDADNAEYYDPSALEVSNHGMPDHNCSSSGNLDTPVAHDNRISLDIIEKDEPTAEAGQGHSSLNDSLLEVEEKVLVHPLNEETSSTIVPIITGTFGSVRSLFSGSPIKSTQPTTSKSIEELSHDGNGCKARKHQVSTTTESDEDASETDSLFQVFQCPLCPKTYPTKHNMERHKKTHFQRYICKTCSRSYSDENNFKRHLEKNLCNQPLTPCKHCGLLVPNRKRHAASCISIKKRAKSKDYSWKQHIQVEWINDAEDVEMGEEIKDC